MVMNEARLEELGFDEKAILIAWLRRGSGEIGFDRPFTWMALGVRGSGKSALLERIGENYLEEGHAVLDLFGAKSAEGLGWLRSEWAKRGKVLCLTAPNCKAKVPNADTKPFTQLELDDFEEYDVVVNSCVFYENVDSEYEAVNKIVDLLWRRRGWRRLVYVLVREAANLIYSRLRLAETQLQAKAFLAYWLREARHSGCSLALDSQRFMAIDVEVRSLVDFLFLKAQGMEGLPDDLRFIYRYVEPTFLQYARPDEFIILSRYGDLGYGVFSLPPWHVNEGEDLPSELGIEVEFEPREGVDRGKYRTVGDEEHASIVASYVEEGLSVQRLAEKFKRSTWTIHNVLKKHDFNVMTLGYCPACRRAKGSFASRSVKRLFV